MHTRSFNVIPTFLLLYLAGFLGVAQAQEGVARVLKPLIEAHAGKVSVAIEVLDADNQTQSKWDHLGTQVMPTASLIKLAIMIEAYRQADRAEISLDDIVHLTDADKVPGSGILTEHLSAGTALSVRDLIRLMIRYSDNTATNLVLEKIGLESTAAAMAKLGFPETQVHSKVYRRDTSIDLERSQRYGLGSTTAFDSVRLLIRLERGELATPKACAEMLEHLKTCDDTGRFPRFLPPGTAVAHKTGAVNKTRTAAGIIYSPAGKIVLCVLTNENEDTSWTDENAAHRLCANLAKAAYDYVNSSQVALSQPSELAKGAAGGLVEDLQRTLNARLGSELSCDGDFGPATESVVKQFQTQHQLAPTGVVDPATWHALGDLVHGDDVVVDPPDVINRASLPLETGLDPNAQPAVTARAFAVMDRTSGAVLASLNGDEPLPNASTTKLMTAYLVLEYATKHPNSLDELVTFSERADSTAGSTCEVKAGEQLLVSELLYGLLLPSGNDASVALAEHFGSRMIKPLVSESKIQGTGANDSYDAFVTAMNAKAAELGLAATQFQNPHGLTQEEHYSSAVDLAMLARAALRLPRFGDYVNCRQRGCRLKSLSGYTRNVVWKNTNRLLSQDGFYGLKTGTTNAAGACLVAAGIREGRDRIVVVLGAANSDARYVDARNLFSWAWRQ
jgi:serine-type D-Ala-D-Ala carboxypeptidase (penicillin-binding protein 5/6)